MACNNSKCECTNCTYDACLCNRAKECVCKPEEASCCCNK